MKDPHAHRLGVLTAILHTPTDVLRALRRKFGHHPDEAINRLIDQKIAAAHSKERIRRAAAKRERKRQRNKRHS